MPNLATARVRVRRRALAPAVLLAVALGFGAVPLARVGPAGVPGVASIADLIDPPVARAADPDENVIVEWTFATSFAPWQAGSSGPQGAADWGRVRNVEWRDFRMLELDGTGNPSRPNAWISLTLPLDENAETLMFEASGHNRDGANASLTVRIVFDGVSTTLFAGTVQGREKEYLWEEQTLAIGDWAGETVTLFFEQNDNGPGQHEQVVLRNARILGEPDCALAGIISDGDDVPDTHSRPLAGVQVQLWKDGSAVDTPVATDETGRYCIPKREGVTDPDEYQLRATLADARHSPPLFSTMYGNNTREAVWTDRNVVEADFDREDIDLTFTGTPERGSWLPDAASVHWEATRFVDWLQDSLGVTPATFGSLKLVVFDESGEGTRYRAAEQTVFLQQDDSVFIDRNQPRDECPENCEWHEIAHHVGARTGIAPTASAAACVGRINHGGWLNETTCDSLSEGFAMWLPVVASLELDGEVGAGYATPDYAQLALNMEDNGYLPWSQVGTASMWQREDFAVAQLLWDLSDAASDEYEAIPITGAADPAVTTLLVGDLVTIPAPQLFAVLDAADVDTVASVLDALLASDVVPDANKQPDPGIDPAVIPTGLSPLGQAFLLHGFHPVRDQADPRFQLGDPVGNTDRAPEGGAYTERRHIEAQPGAAIRLVNSTEAELTFTIEIAYPTTTSVFSVTVDANAEELFGLELPPYARGVPADETTLPACGAADHRLVRVVLTAPGVETRTFDNCEYLHAAANATGDAAMRFGPDAAPTSAPPAPPPGASDVPGPSVVGAGDGGTGMLLPAIGAVLLICVAGAGAWLSRRRRR